MEIISQTIKYSREELNKLIRQMEGNINIVFVSSRLSQKEKELIDYYHKSADLCFLDEDEFSLMIKLFKNKIIFPEGKPKAIPNYFRIVMKSKNALEFVNEIIDHFKLFDFWIINEDKIICLDHEAEICIINKKNLRGVNLT